MFGSGNGESGDDLYDKALAIVAILRARKDVSEHEASTAVDAISITKLREAFPVDDEAGPLAETTESGTDDLLGPSGQSSSTDGEVSPDSATQEPSGDQVSEPSASAPRISAV